MAEPNWIFEDLQGYFCRWQDHYRIGQYVKLKHMSREEWLFIRAYNRFQEVYRERTRRKLAFLHFVPFKTKIDLTLDPSKFNSLKEEFDSINKMWAKLRSWLY